MFHMRQTSNHASDKVVFMKNSMGSWRNPVRILINEPGPSCSKAGWRYPPDKSLSSGFINIRETYYAFALSSGKRFIRLIALSSFWTTETREEYSAYSSIIKVLPFYRQCIPGIRYCEIFMVVWKIKGDVKFDENLFRYLSDTASLRLPGQRRVLLKMTRWCDVLYPISFTCWIVLWRSFLQ